MNPILIILLLVIAIAAIAFALYKLGFSVDKFKVKLGILDVEASREKPTSDEKAISPTGPNIRQRVNDGEISKSSITAPASSDAEIDQQAKNQGRIDDSPIKLT